MNTRPEKGMLAIDPAQVPDSPSWVIDLAALYAMLAETSLERRA